MKEQNLRLTITHFFINIVFIVSGTLCTSMLAIRGTNQQMIFVTLLAMLIYGLLAFYFHFPGQALLKNPIKVPYLLFSLLLTWTALPPKSLAFHQRLPSLANQLAYIINLRLPKEVLTAQRVTTLLNLAAGLALFIFFYWLLYRFSPLVKNFIKNLDRIEKSYLIILLLTWGVLIFLIFNQTNIFYSPQTDGKIIYYDVIYTSDTGIHLVTDVYQNLNAPENDIRQPLFGLYALPFGVAAQLAANLIDKAWLSFTSFSQPNNTYAIICNLLQIPLLGISVILLSRLMDLPSKAEKAIYLSLLSLSYPFLLFSINMEQYIFALFWLIMFIYEAFHNKKIEAAITSNKAATSIMRPLSSNKALWYIGATGSLLTSGILFPLLTLPMSDLSDAKQQQQPFRLFFKQIKPIVNCALQFFAITTLAGQAPLFLTAAGNIKKLLRFAGTHIDLATKLKQYTHFIASCFIAPKASTNFSAYNHISYQLDTVTNPNWLGLILLFLAIIGFVLHRHKPLAKISFGWIIFSFLLLVIVGWGTLENGQILYSLYFSWAFINLAYMAITSITTKSKAKKTFPTSTIRLLFLLLLIMATINIRGIREIIQFGITHYPTT